MKAQYRDCKTPLYNSTFLDEKYDSYIENHPNSSMIAFDFARFKEINDTYGHAVGDDYLKSFGEIILMFFPRYPHSLLIRSGGDEFIIVTNYDNKQISQSLGNIDEAIKDYYNQGILPSMFSFDCGVVPAKKNLVQTKYIADIMLYHAKEQNRQSSTQNRHVTFYNEKILEKARQEEGFVKYVRSVIEREDIQFEDRFIYGDNDRIKELYSKFKNGKTVFSEGTYNLLTRHYLVKKLDLLNIKKIMAYPYDQREKIMLNINSQTLQAREYNFAQHIEESLNGAHLRAENLILSINRRGSTITTEDLAKIIAHLKKLNVKVCIDRYGYIDDPFATSLLALNTTFDYLKIDRNYWYQMDEMKEQMLLANLPVLEYFGIAPIFTSIENKEEYDYIKTLSPSCLGRGRYFN